MLLFLEIYLTIAAWRKGWKGWAILPIAIGMAVAFVIGMEVGASGGSNDSAFAVGLIVDFGIILALIMMVLKKPRQIQQAKIAEAVAVKAKSENE